MYGNVYKKDFILNKDVTLDLFNSTDVIEIHSLDNCKTFSKPKPLLSYNDDNNNNLDDLSLLNYESIDSYIQVDVDKYNSKLI